MTDVVSGLRPGLPALREAICFADWDEFAASGARPGPLPQPRPPDPALDHLHLGHDRVRQGGPPASLGLVNAAGLSAQRAGFRDGDTWINPIPLFHTGGGVLAGSAAWPGATRTRRTRVRRGPGAGADRGGAGQHGAHGADHPAGHAREPRPAAARPVLAAHGDVGRAKVPDTLVRRTTQTFGCEFSILFGQAELHGVLTQTRTPTARRTRPRRSASRCRTSR